MRHAIALLLLLAAAPPALAQVGYPPDKSPYRDIPKKMSLAAVFGYFGGTGGNLGLGRDGRPDVRRFRDRGERPLSSPSRSVRRLSMGRGMSDA
jgi:hypothetical protein